MATISHLPIDVNVGFPQRFKCRVAGVLLEFECRYNPNGDVYTMDIYDQDGNVIVYGKPIVYGSNLLDGIVDDRLPPVAIVAGDTANKHQRAGKGVFGVDVHLWISEPIQR